MKRLHRKVTLGFAAASLACAAAALFLGAGSPAAIVPGALLVARPGATDGVFDRSVVLILEHDPEHTLGVILNRTTAPEGFRFGQGFELQQDDRFGGPVPGPRIALWRDDDVRWTSLEASEPAPEGALLFGGVARWAAGQLEAEVERGSWTVSRLPPADLFGDPDGLWGSAALAAD